jgi:polysaccharide export outer membrane protein
MSIRSIVCAICFVTTAALAATAAAQVRGGPVAPSPTAGAAAAVQTPGNSPKRADDGYVMGPEDMVEVEVLGRSDFKVRSKIGSDGAVQLPFIGSVSAANKTTLQLGDDVRAALEKGGYYKNPIMRVEVVGYASRYVTVLGNVGTPGLVPVDRPYRLSEILARVGGVRENGADYVVLTPEKGEVKKLSVKTLATGDRSQDPFVSPGDKIFSPQAELFYISGQVKTPGAYAINGDMTVRMAVARGGGMTDIGSEKGIKVTHQDGKVEKPGMNGQIRPGDVVVVGERLF